MDDVMHVNVLDFILPPLLQRCFSDDPLRPMAFKNLAASWQS